MGSSQGIAQIAERLIWDQEADGAEPSTLTLTLLGLGVGALPRLLIV